MKAKKLITIAVTAALAIAAFFLLYPAVHVYVAEGRVAFADFKGVRDGCRELLAHKTAFTSEHPQWGSDVVYLTMADKDNDPRIPEAIRKLRPRSLLIGTNYVHLSVGTFHKSGIVVFQEGVEGRGDDRIMDGVWRTSQ